MDKDNVETNAKAFKRNLIKDIVYITAVFMNKKQSGGVSPLITRVYPMERGFINFNQSYELNRLKDKDFITPFQIVSAMVKDQVTDFYSGIHLDIPKEFSKYADRWENTFGKQFQKDINSFRDTTIESILKQYRLLSNINADTMRNIISKIADILDKRESSLKKMTESWYRQMRINMLMWECQDNGYNSYMFIGKDGGCDACSNLSGQIFLIIDAKTGENFPPMHINCRCHIGIVDDFGNLLFEIDGEKLAAGNTISEKEQKLEALTERYHNGNLWDKAAAIFQAIGVSWEYRYKSVRAKYVQGITAMGIDADIAGKAFDMSFSYIAAQVVVGSVSSGAKALTSGNGAGSAVMNLKPQNLMDELANSGVKYNVDDVVMVTKTPGSKLMWLENGSNSAGLKHIVNGHATNFADKGITDIPSFLSHTLQNTPINTGMRVGKPFADYLINGSTYRVAYGTNGFIVSFYPIN